MVDSSGKEKKSRSGDRVSLTLQVYRSSPASLVVNWLREKDRGLFSDPVMAFWNPLALLEQGSSAMDVQLAAISSIQRMEQQIWLLRSELAKQGIELPTSMSPGTGPVMASIDQPTYPATPSTLTGLQPPPTSSSSTAPTHRAPITPATPVVPPPHEKFNLPLCPANADIATDFGDYIELSGFDD